jgi:Fe2+ or Zn2+ uptake regulation protein
MNYKAHFLSHLRLAILRLLAEAPGYSLNSSIITDAVAQLGLAATRDQVRGEIAWLAEQGLAASDDLPGGLMVATLTERGGDVASGRAHVPGVQRPMPKAG